ncbi:hypothetical protein MP228_001740 [Amoeboaphelidium protococcarum]|nr:hypothetical protein MP228_001740 [Amoeboaphelidium protococcarum]
MIKFFKPLVIGIVYCLLPPSTMAHENNHSNMTLLSQWNGVTRQFNITVDQLPVIDGISYQQDSGEDTETLTLFDIFFLGNQTLMEQSFQGQFKEIDLNDDGKVQQDEFSNYWKNLVFAKSLNSQLPWQKRLKVYFSEKVNNAADGGRLEDMIKAAYVQADSDQDGAISFNKYLCLYKADQKCPEMVQTAGAYLDLKIVLPSSYRRVCNAFRDTALAQCSNSTSDRIKSDIDAQYLLCTKGFSLLVQQFDVEKCHLAAASNNITCIDTYNQCFNGISAASKKQSDSTVELQKRSPFPIGVILFDLILDPVLFVGVMSVLTIVVLSSVSIHAAVVSNKNIQQEWLNAQSLISTTAEKWFVGAPLPPCNTPIVWWSDQCLTLMSRKSAAARCGIEQLPEGSSTVPMIVSPQPFYQNACKGHWGKGSRQCRLLGCQPLCIGISGNGCENKMPDLKILYDQDGQSKVKYQ